MSVRIGGKRYYDTEQVAELIGKTSRMVRYYIERGKLKAKRIDDTWLVSENSLDKFLRGSKGPG